MQDFHCEVSKGLQLQHEDLPYHWKSLKILSLKCEFSVAFTWRNMPQRHRSVVPNPATSGNRQYIRNKVKQSKPIAVVQWQETSLWQTQNLSGDISRLVCRLMDNESQKQLSHASELTSVLTVVQLSCLEGSYSDDVKGRSDDSLDQLSLLFIRRDVGIGAWRRTFQVKGIGAWTA